MGHFKAIEDERDGVMPKEENVKNLSLKEAREAVENIDDLRKRTCRI